MAYEAARIIDATANVVRVEHPAVPDFPATSINAVAAGVTSLVAGDNTGLANGNYLLIGQICENKTEQVAINGAVTYGTALTVTPALTFDHPEGTPLQKILWNQVEISGAATVTGSKTVIDTITITYGQPDTELVITGTTYAYYFARYKNSGSGTFSAYSDAAPAAGYGADTVRSVKVTALERTGEHIDSTGVITDAFLNREITNCEVDIWKEKRRWAQFYVDGYVLGTLTAGVTDFALPSDISDPNTQEAIRAVRVRQIGMLEYVDIEAIEGLLWDTAVTTLASQALAGDTTAYLTSVADFQDGGGSVLLGSDTVTYTGRDTTLNTLTGIPASGDGAITQTWPATTTYVWQGGNVEISPTVFTVKPGYLSIVLPPAPSYQGQAIYLSYYAKPTYPNSDADLIEWPDPELYHLWLAWKITLRRQNGTPNDQALSFQKEYNDRKALLLSRARLQDSPKFLPARRFPRQSYGRWDDSSIVPWIISS